MQNYISESNLEKDNILLIEKYFTSSILSEEESKKILELIENSEYCKYFQFLLALKAENFSKDIKRKEEKSKTRNIFIAFASLAATFILYLTVVFLNKHNTTLKEYSIIENKTEKTIDTIILNKLHVNISPKSSLVIKSNKEKLDIQIKEGSYLVFSNLNSDFHFTVMAGKYEIEKKGTIFSVNYPNENKIELEVKEGLVKLTNNVTKTSFDISENKIFIDSLGLSKPIIEEVSQITNPIIECKIDDPIFKIISIFEKYYNCKIKLSEKLSHLKMGYDFTNDLSKKDIDTQLKDIKEIIESNNPFKVTIKKNGKNYDIEI